MLAQNFKTAQELGLLQVEYDALVNVLRMFERKEIRETQLRMDDFITVSNDSEPECGTVACICGWAHTLSGGKAFPEIARNSWALAAMVRRLPNGAQDLFRLGLPPYVIRQEKHSVENAAVALRNYLTTGTPSWRNIWGA